MHPKSEFLVLNSYTWELPQGLVEIPPNQRENSLCFHRQRGSPTPFPSKHSEIADPARLDIFDEFRATSTADNNYMNISMFSQPEKHQACSTA